jgi:hypothetical protein
MKSIKSGLLILLTIAISPCLLRGQEYKIPVQNSRDVRLILTNFTGELPVEGYNGNEIIISSSSENIVPPERAKGLKPIYPGGTDNSGLGLSVEKTGDQISITCLLPFTKHNDYRLRVPDNLALEIKSGCERSNRISVENMKNELDINNCHDIELKNVTGPLVLSTISGDIDITFGNIATDKPFSVNSISGDIDVALPVKTATELTLRTLSGGFYSDFEINSTQKDLKQIGGNQLNFVLNGGGFKFLINTISGNIYLRKAN